MSNAEPGVRAREGTLSGLTENEAKEFHKIFMMSFAIFTLIAIIAHFLVWQWRPWLPGPEGYSAMILEAPRYAAAQIISFLV
ncbi:MAG: light-harvesting antenna LH1, beta subunit [bacterium]